MLYGILFFRELVPSVLATGGNVVSFGDLNRRFRAFDDQTGEVT